MLSTTYTATQLQLAGYKLFQWTRAACLLEVRQIWQASGRCLRAATEKKPLGIFY